MELTRATIEGGLLTAESRFPASARCVLVAMLALGLAACGSKQADKGGGQPPAVVTTAVLAPSPWMDSIEALGTATARESVSITAKVSETVAQVRFESGQAVRAGDVLVTLSDSVQLAGLDEASAAYREAQKNFERQQSLVQRHWSPPVNSTSSAHCVMPPRDAWTRSARSCRTG